MGALIDTSVLIAIERGDLDVSVLEDNDLDLAISTITVSGLLHGVHRAAEGARRSQREAWVEALLARLPVLPFDLIAARIHARLAARSRTEGVSLGAHDLLIGATALAKGLEVVTRDQRSFGRIPDLEVRYW